MSNFKNFKEERLASEIESIHKTIVLEHPVKSIPESTFLNEILPVITGEVTSVGLPILVAAVAGSPFSELNVEDEKGNVLFRMPSLMERNVINPSIDITKGSLKNVFITAEMLLNRSKAQAENFLAHQLRPNETSNEQRTKLEDDRLSRWAAIAARYGKSLPGVKVSNGKAITGTSSSPELVYGDDDLA